MAGRRRVVKLKRTSKLAEAAWEWELRHVDNPPDHILDVFNLLEELSRLSNENEAAFGAFNATPVRSNGGDIAAGGPVSRLIEGNVGRLRRIVGSLCKEFPTAGRCGSSRKRRELQCQAPPERCTTCPHAGQHGTSKANLSELVLLDAAQA